MRNIKILFLILTLIGLSSCKIGRFFIYNFADIKDYKKFPSRELKGSSTPFRFAELEKDAITIQSVKYKGDTAMSFEDFLEKSGTVAFLVIRNDSILLERYSNKYSRESIVASFSMAKSYVSALIGCAIADGYIQSVNDPVTKYLPELKENGFDSVRLIHLLQMTSALKYNESYYNPFGDAATQYYGRRLRQSSLKSTLLKTRKPGEKFEYTSGTTQMLGMVLERAIKEKSVTEYFQEKIWGPLQMEYDASWSIDRKNDGMEKAFCCINARARDFAKFGRLYLNNGNWEGHQIISEEWVKTSTGIDTTQGSVWRYNYQWWIRSKDAHDFDANGHLGQYIYVNRKTNTIIVRLGKKWGNFPWINLFKQISGD